MLVVYDLDGTLVDTRLANLRAYEKAGITPPCDFHIRDWKTWTTSKIHDAKNRFLESVMAENVVELPLLENAQEEGAMVLSNISFDAFNILRLHVNLVSLYIHIEMDSMAKVKFLKDMEEEHRIGIYIDDSLLTCQLVQQMTSWQVLHAGRF